MEAVDLSKTRDFYNPGDGHYVYDCINRDGVLFEATQVRRNRDGEIVCALDVRAPGFAGAALLDDKDEKGTIVRCEVAVISRSASLDGIARDIHRRARTSSEDAHWRDRLDELAFKVGIAESHGEPGVWLDEVQPSTDDPVFTVDRLPLLCHLPQIIFGEGASMKSYLATYLAGRLAMQGVKVLYADWELTEDVHARRLRAMFGSELVGKIRYVKCNRPLVQEVERLAREKHQHQLTFAVCDSIAFGCNGKPEDAVVAQDYFRALRGLRVGSVLLAHNAGAAEHKETRPFGSVFWHNGARMTWFAKAEQASIGDTARTVVLINRKVLDRPVPSALAFRFNFADQRTTVTACDPTSVDSDDAMKSLPAWMRIKAVVSRRPLTVTEIAEETGIKEGTIRQNVTRKTELFTLIPGSGGAQKVALLERRAS